MTKRNLVFGIASLVGVSALIGTTATVCAQDQQQQQKGQARIVERRGPEVDLRQNARAQVVVLFPGAIQQGSSQGDVEICLVESQISQSSDDQGQQGQAQSTGREILFSSRDAQNGVVSYGLDAAGNGRKLMVIARVNGEMVEVRQSGGGEGAMFYTVQRPQNQQTAQGGNQGGGQMAQNSGGGSGSGQGSQQGGSGAGQSGQSGQSGGGSDPQAQGQMDQSQTHQLQQAQQQEQAAIIVVYTGGGQQ
jgi:hypothetical protein